MEDVALIAELHSLPSADLAPPLDVTPQRKKEKTFEALLRQVEGLSRQQPVLMVFDDLHWIDPSSRELLDRVIERVADWPVLLLAMFRPEFQPPWTGQPHVTMLTLARLDRRDTAAMVANVAGNAALPPEIMEEIAERTDGVPLFVEELTKAVLEAGAQGPAALSAVPHPALSVPATLHASLMARLDRLGPAAKDVAQTGAAIGREFGFGLLASITDLPEPQLHEALDRLTNAGLLFVRGTPPQSSYIFKHALVQDAAYGTLLRSRRQQLHAPYRRDPRRALSGDRVGATRAVGPPLRGSRSRGKVGRLLAEGRSAGAGALGDVGSGRPVAEGVGYVGRSAGRPVAPATGAGPAIRARIGAFCHVRLFGVGSGRDAIPSLRAGWATGSTRVPGTPDLGPILVSFRAGRAQAGAAARRAARKNRQVAERRRDAIAWPLLARRHPLFSRRIRCRPRHVGTEYGAC